MTYQIIYLNGPSSSGKTTLAKALQEALEEPYLHVGIDKIIGWMPEKINDWTGGEAPLGYSWKKSEDESGHLIQELQMGPFAQKIGTTFREVVLVLAKMGHRLIIDDVSMGKQQVDEWKKMLKNFQVLWVGVSAPLSVLEHREKERGNRILGSARGQLRKVHVDTLYNLEIDTYHVALSENVEKIKSLVSGSPAHEKSLIEQMPSDDLLKRCADTWGLRNLVFVRKMENIVFVGASDAGKVYLRLTTPLRRARSEIEAEINWIEHLGKCGLRVPRIILNRDGRKISSFTEENQHYEAVVFSAIEGEHPAKEIVTKPEFLKTLGSLIAKMHQASQSYEGAHQDIKREEWFEERGLRHALQAAAISKETSLRHQLEAAVSWMQQLPRNSETYGLIHADLGALNLFIAEESSIGIIDFDDSCYHWFVFDLAIVVFSMAGRFKHATSQPEEKIWLADLVEGYRTIRPLSQEAIDWIPKFINFACLRLFFWIEYHESLHTFHQDSLDKVAQQKQWTKDRISSSS